MRKDVPEKYMKIYYIHAEGHIQCRQNAEETIKDKYLEESPFSRQYQCGGS